MDEHDPRVVNDGDVLIHPGNSYIRRLIEWVRRRCCSQFYCTVFVLFFINLINYMDRYTLAGVLEKLKLYYGISNASGGLIQTLFVVSFMVFAPLFGYLGDRFNRKLIVIIGITVWSLAVLASSFVPENYFWLFAVCRCVVGVGEASYTTVAPTMLADLSVGDQRSRALMVFYFAVPVGSGLGFVVGSYVADAASDWRWGLRVTPMLAVVSLIMLMLLVREPQRGAAEHRSASSSVSHNSWIIDVKQILRIPTYLITTFAFTCAVYSIGALSYWIPLYFLTALRMTTDPTADDDQVSPIFGAITAVSGITGVLLGSFSSQWLRHRNPRADPLICAIGVLLSVPCAYVSIILAQYSMTVAWVVMFFGVTSLCVTWPIIPDMLLYVVTPPRRATASALQILISHALGDAASPYIVGKMIDVLRRDSSEAAAFHAQQTSLLVTLFIAIAGSALFFLAAFFVEKDKRRAEEEAEMADDETD